MSDQTFSVSADTFAKIQEIAKREGLGLRTRRRRGVRVVPHSAVIELVCADILQGGAR